MFGYQRVGVEFELFATSSRYVRQTEARNRHRLIAQLAGLLVLEFFGLANSFKEDLVG